MVGVPSIKMVIRGMVYYCYTNITETSTISNSLLSSHKKCEPFQSQGTAPPASPCTVADAGDAKKRQGEAEIRNQETYGGYHGNILEIYMDADTSSYRDFECIWVSFFLFYSKSVRVK